MGDRYGKTSSVIMGCWVIMLAVHLGRPQIVFCVDIIFLSSFLMAGSEYGTA